MKADKNLYNVKDLVGKLRVYNDYQSILVKLKIINELNMQVRNDLSGLMSVKNV